MLSNKDNLNQVNAVKIRSEVLRGPCMKLKDYLYIDQIVLC